MTPLAITALSTVNALGIGLDATAEGLWANRIALRPCDYEDAHIDTHIGRVPGVEDVTLPTAFARFDCRNNRLAEMAVRADGFEGAAQAAIRRYGAHRVALILGTSTSGVRAGEVAFARRDPKTDALPDDFRFHETHDHHALAWYVSERLGIAGPTMTVSTACSSSAKVFADAHQLIEAGLVDAAIVGGADSLCLMTLYGFKSLDLLDTGPARPNDADRRGISIGEGAGLALVEREVGERPALARLLGYGESSDAHHMSAPHPTGLGAELSMRAALERAGLDPGAVDYINQHGTGSTQNDQSETQAIARVFGPQLRCSSTKGATGHTLGAAGIIETAICICALTRGFRPGNSNLETLDPEIPTTVQRASEAASIDVVLMNSFGFGGSNCSLLLGHGDASVSVPEARQP
ncbi:beta-ketoacyl-[acyl-carrier-protein] synthase family protein [Rhodovibrio salinarum]|uniref:Beta-ketoacyl-[acyl-carrier-protein] synthase II n=1 Tax=Rhodovibrio salinarum TaxID=1087 RepID=A0A934QM14_9PROT|nr:beta-ketoacyl-[acyl-carrier-protein] synthase family protein [Rhodovibrio salinarum]MBK1699094.1 beta-ketoacyl-[acyl-carrier-protein] synthase II [Rhodovibrio salinarum]